MPEPSEVVTFDRVAVHLDALQRAAYALAREMTIDIRADGSEWRCGLFPEPGVSAARLAGQLRREVNDQTLRLRIAAETEPLRNLIFAIAFSRAGLIDEPTDNA